MCSEGTALKDLSVLRRHMVLPAAAWPHKSSHKKAARLGKPEALEFKFLGPLSLLLMLLRQRLTDILATNTLKHNRIF